MTDFQFFLEVLDSFWGADELILAQCPELVSLDSYILDEPSVVDDLL